MKVIFDAIFMPPYTKSGSISHAIYSYFIVTPETYKSIIGFSPITNNEYFHMHDQTYGNEYFNKNRVYTDRVNMYAYELVFAKKISLKDKDSITQMVQRLEKEGQIRRINIEIEVEDNVFF